MNVRTIKLICILEYCNSVVHLAIFICICLTIGHFSVKALFIGSDYMNSPNQSSNCTWPCDFDVKCPPLASSDASYCGHGLRLIWDECRCCAICERLENESCTLSIPSPSPFSLVHEKNDLARTDNALKNVRQRGVEICQTGLKCVNLSTTAFIIGSGYNSTADKSLPDRTGVCTAISNDSCLDPVEIHGCNLYVKQGCRCWTIKTCDLSIINHHSHHGFRYENETACLEDWAEIKSAWQETCLKAKCGIVFQPKCPDDSTLVLADPPVPPECCQKPGKCVCDPEFCKKSALVCSSGHDTVMVDKATGEPGSCCDIYKCIPPPLDCSSLYCPPQQIDDCPPDSYRPQSSSNSSSGDDDDVTALRTNRCCPVVEQCACKPGICEPVAACPQDFHLEVVKKGTGLPGSCCDVFHCVSAGSTSETCDHLGKIYPDGQSWRPSPCTECACKGGLVFCKKFECPETNFCSLVKVPDHECCPICIGCKAENGEYHNFTDQWQKDECTTCTCGSTGAVLCHEQMCSIDCEQPVKIPGRCCPVCEQPLFVPLPYVCPSIELCTLLCEHGMKRDHRGCFLCECEKDPDLHTNATSIEKILTPNNKNDPQHHCPPRDETLCSRKCSHGYERNEQGCLQCKCKQCPPINQCYKSCLYGFQTNQYGCQICKCKGAQSPEGPSLLPLPPPTNDLDHVTCRSPDSTHDHGEWWYDGCRYCYCDNGREFCSVLSCESAKDCENPKFDKNGCCESCTGKSLNGSSHSRLVCHSPGSGRNFVEGEYWSLDPCVQCTCHIGHVLCHKRSCGPVPCQNPKYATIGRCCPSCDTEALKIEVVTLTDDHQQNDGYCTVGGETYSSGSQWKSDLCTSCTCNKGVVSCYEERCSNQGCSDRLLHLKNACCPICTANLHNNGGFCRYKDLIYTIGEHWKDGACRNCTCKDEGDVLCTQFECPKCSTNGENRSTTVLPGQCCPLCDDHDDRWNRASTPFYNNYGHSNSLTALILFCAFGALVVSFVTAMLVLWWRKKTGHRQHLSSESSSRSDPILGGYKYHEQQSMLDKMAPTYDESKKHALFISPYDSDGASTGLTSEGV